MKFGERVFSCAGPAVWNSLPVPDELHRTPTINSYKRKPKTFVLFFNYLFFNVFDICAAPMFLFFVTGAF